MRVTNRSRPLDGSKVAIGPRLAHISTVLNGVTKDGKPTAMVAWKGTLSDVDIASVVTYERNSWGNHTGEAVQPRTGPSAGQLALKFWFHFLSLVAIVAFRLL